MNQEEAKKIAGLGEDLFKQICDREIKFLFKTIERFAEKGFIYNHGIKLDMLDLYGDVESFSFDP